VPRCATACLLLVLSKLYPTYSLVFQLLIALDISSHWMHMYRYGPTDQQALMNVALTTPRHSSLISGSESHKKVSADTHWFLKLYYESRLVLFFMCAGNELFFVMLYAVHHFGTPILIASSPYGPLSLWHLLTLASLPFFIVKQILSVIQMIGASEALTEKDLNDRKVKAAKATKSK